MANGSNLSKLLFVLGGVAAFGVVLIAGALFVVQLYLKSQLHEAQVAQARTETLKLESKAEEYYAFHGKWPPDLQTLVTPPKGEPYLRESALLDPWGHKYVLFTNGKGIVVKSPGPDGTMGTEDDV